MVNCSSGRRVTPVKMSLGTWLENPFNFFLFVLENRDTKYL